MPYHLAMAPYTILYTHIHKICKYFFNDSYGNRTRVTAVKGRCLNRLTKEPFLYASQRSSCLIYCTFKTTHVKLFVSNFCRLVRFFGSVRPSAAFLTLGQALDRLVAVSSIHCCTSTSALSTSSSSRGLTPFGWDISS